MIELPVLGLGDDECPGHTVVWRDGTVICRGILGTLEEVRARVEACAAEEAKKQELREGGITVLDDHR